MQDTEHKIRERAYHRWVENGRREGEADTHWIEAEREVLAAYAATTNGEAATKPRKARKAPAKSKKRAA